jgi:hypothetical protein
MYSRVKDIEIFERSLNDNPNPILLVDKETYDVLYWNIAYRIFLLNYFKISPDNLENIKDYPRDLYNTFLDIVEKTRETQVYSYESEIGDVIIKTQIVNSAAYFILFVDVTQVRKLLKNYKEKNEELKELEKSRKYLLMKNIRLWSILSSRIIQILFGFIVFLGLISNLIKDYYIGEYEKDRKRMSEFIVEQNEVKIQMLEAIKQANELNNRTLQILEVREKEVLKTLREIRKNSETDKKQIIRDIKRYGFNIGIE